MTVHPRLGLPFAAGVVGSLPRPAAVRDILPEEQTAQWTDVARSDRMDAAVAYAIALQDTAGLDVISDGEWRRYSYTNIVGDIAEGFSPGTYYGIHVTEPLQPTRAGVAAEHARFLVEATDRATKVCLPSPYILGIRLWDPELSKKAYPTRESLMEALVPIMRQEVQAVAEAGVSVIQIDEPELNVMVDPRARAKFDDPEYELALASDMINAVVEGVEGVRTAVHLCHMNTLTRGWLWEGGYGPVIDTLNKIKVDQFVLEFTIPAAGDVSALKDLRDDCLIGLGCVDCRSEHADTPEEIVARVEAAMRYVDKERLSLNPDCGFAPSIRFKIPLDEAYLKLRNEAEAVRILRDKYG